jgi:hypothetical protein
MKKAKTTEIGYYNRNRQTVINKTGRPGSDYNQKIFALQCGDCGFCYGSNGSDNWQRKCPNCQDGRPCSDPFCAAVKTGGDGNCEICRRAKNTKPNEKSEARRMPVIAKKNPMSATVAGIGDRALQSDDKLIRDLTIATERYAKILRGHFAVKGKGLKEVVAAINDRRPNELPPKLRDKLRRIRKIRNSHVHSSKRCFLTDGQKREMANLLDAIDAEFRMSGWNKEKEQ